MYQSIGGTTPEHSKTTKKQYTLQTTMCLGLPSFSSPLVTAAVLHRALQGADQAAPFTAKVAALDGAEAAPREDL